jgi:hypothetical protein
VTFWARSDATRSLKVTIGQYFGNGGSEAVVKVVDVFPLSTAWGKYSATFQVPSIAGKMLGANDYLRLAFDLPLNVLQTVDLTQVQLEEGPVSTPFEYRLSGEELTLCQRYFEKSFANRLPIRANNGTGTCIVSFTQAAPGNTGQYGMVVDMQTQKRVQPTVVLYCPGNASNQIWNYSQGVPCTGTIVQSVTQRSFAIGTVTPVNSQPGNGLQIEWTADAEI